MQNFAPKELYNKYCECALKFNKIFGLKDYEILVNCLNEKCTEKYVIWKGAGLNFFNNFRICNMSSL